MEEKIFCTVKKSSAYRKRYDSEMNFDQFLDVYGAPPEPPRLKPLVEPDDDIPPFELQESTIEDKDEEKNKDQFNKKIFYRLESIPQIEDSENNSMMLCSPKKGQFEEQKEKNEGQKEQEFEKPKFLARRRRCQSETVDYQILTFLSESSKGKKKIKRQ